MIASVCRLPRYRAQQAVTRLDTDGRVLDLDSLGCIGERNCTDFISSDLVGIDNLDNGSVDVGCYHDIGDLDCIIDDLRYIAPSRGDRSLYGRFVSRLKPNNGVA